MNSTVNQSNAPGFSHVPKGRAIVKNRVLPKSRTSKFERFLLIGVVSLLPMESNLPKLGELSSLFIVFGLLFGYLIVCRPGVLLRVAKSPVFVAGYFFVASALVMEIFHDSLDFKTVIRILFMIIGAICVASSCRDRAALQSCMYGYVLGSLLLAPILLLTLLGFLNAAEATDFQDASTVRVSAMGKTGLQSNLNAMAFSLAQGTLVAFVLAVFARMSFKKVWLLGLTFIFGVATFLPMSRSGVLILLISLATILYLYGALNPKVIISLLILSVGLLAVLPDAVLTRFTVSSQQDARGNYEDSRTELYLTTLRNVPEFILAGVGRSEFYGQWGARHGFAGNVEHTNSGSHNSFSEVAILWGLPGLAAFLALVWQAYRCLPKRPGTDPLRLCVVALAVSALGLTMVMHNFEAKEFSLVLGILVGSNLQVWPELFGPKQKRLERKKLRNILNRGNQSSPMST